MTQPPIPGIDAPYWMDFGPKDKVTIQTKYYDDDSDTGEPEDREHAWVGEAVEAIKKDGEDAVWHKQIEVEAEDSDKGIKIRVALAGAPEKVNGGSNYAQVWIDAQKLGQYLDEQLRKSIEYKFQQLAELREVTELASQITGNRRRTLKIVEIEKEA